MRGLVVVVLSCVSSIAFADAIDDAMGQLEIGELDQARSLLDAAQVRDRGDVVRMLEARARLAHATRDDEAVIEALRRLDALEPEHAFGPSVPPELRERLNAMNTPRLSVSVTGAELGTGLSLVVRVDDAAGLVRESRLFVRVDGQTSETTERTFAVPLAPGGRAEIWAELRGEGGVVLERSGSSESPNVIERGSAGLGDADPNRGAYSAGSDAGSDSEPSDSNDRRRRTIIGVVIAGIVLLAVGGSIGGVYYAKSNRDARLGQPVLR